MQVPGPGLKHMQPFWPSLDLCLPKETIVTILTNLVGEDDKSLLISSVPPKSPNCHGLVLSQGRAALLFFLLLLEGVCWLLTHTAGDVQPNPAVCEQLGHLQPVVPL